MGNKSDEVDASLGFPGVVGGDREQQQAIRKAAKNPAHWFSKVVNNLLDEKHPAHGITQVEEYSIKDDDVEYSGDALSFMNERGAKLLFTRGSVAGRIEPIQGKIKPEHLSPSPYNQKKIKNKSGTSHRCSADEAGVPLSLFSTFKNAGIEENEAKQSAQTLETDFRDVWSSEDEKDDERIQQKYFASAKKKEDEIIRKKVNRELRKLA